jgi:hypothetical protein
MRRTTCEGEAQALRLRSVFKSIMHDPKPADEPAAEPKTERPEEERPKEYGGRKGPDPTRFGDWEKNGRCIDF